MPLLSVSSLGDLRQAIPYFRLSPSPTLQELGTGGSLAWLAAAIRLSVLRTLGRGWGVGWAGGLAPRSPQTPAPPSGLPSHLQDGRSPLVLRMLVIVRKSGSGDEHGCLAMEWALRGMPLLLSAASARGGAGMCIFQWSKHLPPSQDAPALPASAHASVGQASACLCRKPRHSSVGERTRGGQDRTPLSRPAPLISSRQARASLLGMLKELYRCQVLLLWCPVAVVFRTGPSIHRCALFFS